MASSMSGEWLRLDGFLEYPDPVTGVTKQFCSLTDANNICLLSPYPTSNTVQVIHSLQLNITHTLVPASSSCTCKHDSATLPSRCPSNRMLANLTILLLYVWDNFTTLILLPLIICTFCYLLFLTPQSAVAFPAAHADQARCRQTHWIHLCL